MSTLQASDSTRARRRVAVVTDSTTYLPASLLERWGIHPVSLYVGWEGELQPESDYVDLDAFYTRLHDSPQLPTTSQPSVGDFLACYQPLLRAGHDVVSVHIASGLSGTCQSAREAARTIAEEHQAGEVHVLDSQTGAGGLGCLVLLAAALAAQGATLEQVLSGVQQGRESLDIWFCLDTLEYLRRGGRIGAGVTILLHDDMVSIGEMNILVDLSQMAAVPGAADAKTQARVAQRALEGTGVFEGDTVEAQIADVVQPLTPAPPVPASVNPNVMQPPSDETASPQ